MNLHNSRKSRNYKYSYGIGIQKLNKYQLKRQKKFIRNLESKIKNNQKDS